jgi:uncharacterized protein YecT (DUF1311 family)
MILAAAVAVFALLPTPYQDHHCDDPQNQNDMNACAAIDFGQADAALNEAWRSAAARASAADHELDRRYDRRPTSAAKLHEAQRAWIVFRDADCALLGYDEARGGSMEPMVYEGCRAQLTRERTRQLREPSE